MPGRKSTLHNNFPKYLFRIVMIVCTINILWCHQLYADPGKAINKTLGAIIDGVNTYNVGVFKKIVTKERAKYPLNAPITIAIKFSVVRGGDGKRVLMNPRHARTERDWKGKPDPTSLKEETLIDPISTGGIYTIYIYTMGTDSTFVPPKHEGPPVIRVPGSPDPPKIPKSIIKIIGLELTIKEKQPFPPGSSFEIKSVLHYEIIDELLSPPTKKIESAEVTSYTKFSFTGGKLQPMGNGQFQIPCDSEGKSITMVGKYTGTGSRAIESKTTGIQVGVLPLQTLTITPSKQSIAPGESVRFQADAVWDNGMCTRRENLHPDKLAWNFGGLESTALPDVAQAKKEHGGKNFKVTGEYQSKLASSTIKVLKGPWFVYCKADSAHVTNTEPFGASLSIGDFEFKSQAETFADKINISGDCKQRTCPIGHSEVPYLKGLLEPIARQTLIDASLIISVDGHENSTDVSKGAVIRQNPNSGTCVKKGAKVSVILSKGTAPIDTPAKQLSAELNCGSAIEIEAGAEPSRICGIVVRGWKPEGKVTVSVGAVPQSSGIRIFPGNTSQEAFNMHTTGPSDFHDRYIFDQLISAKGTAPEGMTAILFTVTQEGHGRVSLPLNISVLPSGRTPSRGGGVRPPVEPATGSSGGLYCVWRSKSFGDGPNCFNINRAQCDSPKYAGNPKYELVGSNMTPVESAALASRLSPYKGDAYGCHRTPPEEQEPGEGPETAGGSDTGSGQGAGGASGSGSGEDTGKGESTGEGESHEEDKAAGKGEGSGEDEGTEENQEADEGEEDPDLLAGFPDTPGDAPPEDDAPITPEQAEAVEGFDESGPTSHLPPSDPDQMVSENADGTPPVDIAAVAQAEREQEEARDREREGNQRDEAQQADEDRQTINQQNAQDQQAQDAAAQQGVTQAQAQGQVMIDQANQNADPIMSGQDMAEAIDKIQQEGDDKIQAIDDQIRQGLGGAGQTGGGSGPQPLPPPPSMGNGPVDTAVVQCNAKYGAGGDNPGFYTIDFSGATGVANFEFDTESIKDEMEVSAGGATFNTTCRSNGETVPITIPSPNTPVTVTVRPNCDCKKPPCKGTHWSFTFHCPTSAGASTNSPAQPVMPQGGILGQ